MSSEILSSNEFISSLAGAFFGALAAFIFSAIPAWKKSRDAQHAAIVKAQYTLGLQRNDLANLLGQFLEPNRNSPARHLKMPHIFYQFTKLRIDLAELTFLVTAKYGNELTEIHLAQSAFENSLAVLKEFNSTKLRFQEKAIFRENLGDQMGKFEISSNDMIVVHELESLLTTLYQIVEDTIKRLDQAIITLARVGKEHIVEHTYLAYAIGSPKKTPPPSVI